MIETAVRNLPAWMAQVVLLTAAGAVLPLLFGLRHPRTQLAYFHALLIACLLLPAVEPWSHPVVTLGPVGVDRYPGGSSSRSSTSGDLGNVPTARGLPSAPAATGWVSPPVFGARAMDARALPWILAGGALARLSWLLGGLWQIRKRRIGATPLYPIPDSIRAAAAITHADALFCVSPEVRGPVMLGWLAPIVLLPERFLELDEEAQCAIACHELLHVRRADWVVTLLEELAAALVWFNPAAWLLLAQTRLVREELVDEETVRLTASREPYVEALLAIARDRQTLDLAPAPLFLRRRHLTHRMHSLLKETSMSKRRLVLSYGSMSAILAVAGWFTCLSFPLTGQPRVVAAPATVGDGLPAVVAMRPLQKRGARRSDTSALRPAPIPPDAQEPVTGSAHSATDPAERAAALALVERARSNGLTHRPGTPPYRLEATFSSFGASAYVGSGQLTETWLSGQRWRWTAALGGYSVTRVPGAGTASGESVPGAVPMRLHMLRNAIFWAIPSIPGNFQIRTAAVPMNGRAATCLLASGITTPAEQTRLWEEEEFCIDNTSGVLLVHSIAPGSYAVYGYGRNLDFHGRATPDRITIYINGARILDAQVNLTDAGAVNESELVATPEMIAAGPVSTLDSPARFPMTVANASISGMKPVMVHASVDGRGQVVEEELLTASDPGLVQLALDRVKNTRFPALGSQRQMYINVKFTPAQ